MIPEVECGATAAGGCPMPRHESQSEVQGRRDLEALLAAIRNGEIESIEDLEPREVAMLLEHERDGEELEDLFDRLRASEPEPS
jgi:hypothetical protein